MVNTIIFLGLVNWITTEIIVVSEIFRPLREFVDHRLQASMERRLRDPEWLSDQFAAEINEQALATVIKDSASPFWREARYFVGCHLCVGTWVGIIEAAFIGPLVLHGVVGFVATALTFKALGHFTLELVAVLKKAGQQ